MSDIEVNDRVSSYNDLYLRLRNFNLQNMELVDKPEFCIRAFDYLLKKQLTEKRKGIGSCSDEELEKHGFRNARELLQIDKISYSASEMEYHLNPRSNVKIEELNSVLTGRIGYGLKDTFTVFSSQITGQPVEAFLGINSEYDEANITIYTKLLGLLLIRTIYNDINITPEKFSDSMEYIKIQFFLGRFCIINFENWIRDYLRDNSFYNTSTELSIEEMRKSKQYRKLIHGFSNADFNM